VVAWLLDPSSAAWPPLNILWEMNTNICKNSSPSNFWSEEQCWDALGSVLRDLHSNHDATPCRWQIISHRPILSLEPVWSWLPTTSIDIQDGSISRPFFKLHANSSPTNECDNEYSCSVLEDNESTPVPACAQPRAQTSVINIVSTKTSQKFRWYNLNSSHRALSICGTYTLYMTINNFHNFDNNSLGKLSSVLGNICDNDDGTKATWQTRDAVATTARTTDDDDEKDDDNNVEDNNDNKEWNYQRGLHLTLSLMSDHWSVVWFVRVIWWCSWDRWINSDHIVSANYKSCANLLMESMSLRSYFMST
jgi:hypothetical protein